MFPLHLVFSFAAVWDSVKEGSNTQLCDQRANANVSSINSGDAAVLLAYDPIIAHHFERLMHRMKVLKQLSTVE